MVALRLALEVIVLERVVSSGVLADVVPEDVAVDVASQRLNVPAPSNTTFAAIAFASFAAIVKHAVWLPGFVSSTIRKKVDSCAVTPAGDPRSASNEAATAVPESVTLA